ncbi:MAG TPA: PRD domain-containing protein [Micropruina sp.]|jgi:beta-glucoside operon transcriptional antiterminator|nr:PRD domain-containing protein [Micropruina sp.]
MEILRVFNNNLVLALDEAGRDVILTGRGLGFQAKPGQPVDTAKVVRTFVPIDGRDPDHLADMLAGIPPEHIHLVGQALAEIGLDSVSRNPAMVIALADHISFALRRITLGMTIVYPLLAEVKNLYAEEYAQAEALLRAVNARTDVQLPDLEAVGLALHLVNAGFATGDLSYTYQMTGVIQQMVRVIEEAFDVTLDSGSVSVGRFITHLRYLFVRISQHKQLDAEPSLVGAAIRESFPEASECAVRLAGLLELRLGADLTSDEVSYLALHVARVTTPDR